MAATKEAGAGNPAVRPGGVVTLALLKARLDEGEDHLGIFMPLVLDVLPTLTDRYFIAADVQRAVAEVHGVSMPQEAVSTLLKRAARQDYVRRESGRFRVDDGKELPRQSLTGEKDRLAVGQQSLGQSLLQHARSRGLELQEPSDALDLLLRFLEEEQTALLLGAPAGSNAGRALSTREAVVVAEFVNTVATTDPALRSVLSDLLEGLVLYHAAFLPDLTEVDRRFRNLNVYFDSDLVRQALGYEGEGARILMRDTIDLLRSSGVDCLVLDKTVAEIHRILAMFEGKMGTSAGRRSLRPTPMARHFLTQRYAPSDVQEMAALLEQDVAAVGLTVHRMPKRIEAFTANEAALAERLTDTRTHDTLEPRVMHDVDCVAAVLTMRRGRRSTRVEDVGAVFVSSSSLVIRNTRLWWEEDERESGIPPLVHVRSLANLAWLKRPTARDGLQLKELISLCCAAMRPSPKTWHRFLDHLDGLLTSHRLTQDEVTAIIVSAVSDQVLKDVELDDSTEDMDAVTLDEVVERVKADYGADAERRVCEVQEDYERRLAELQARADAEAAEAAAGAEERKALAEASERSAAEALRRQELAASGRARRWAKRAVGWAYWLLVVLVMAGEVAILLTFPFKGDWLGVLVGVGVVVATGFGAVGLLRHLSELRIRVEASLQARFRDWLLGRDDRVDGPGGEPGARGAS